MKKTIILLVCALLLTPGLSLAHPGRTASDDCHYCRTNCDSWGVAWNQRHCHGGYTAPVQTYTSPPEPKPTPTPVSTSEPVISYDTLAETTAELIYIIDGDTIKVRLKDGSEESVRLIGIDTPEINDPRKDGPECFAKEATDNMREILGNSTLTLKRKADENRDVYNRLLRYVFVGDTFVNEEMVRQGYAHAYLNYPFDQSYMDQFKSYENQARTNGLGLWAPGTCENPAVKNVATTTTSTPSAEESIQDQPVKTKTQPRNSFFKRMFRMIILGPLSFIF
jgi:endonuclease YncB( thermonuclease family)